MVEQEGSACIESRTTEARISEIIVRPGSMAWESSSTSCDSESRRRTRVFAVRGFRSSCTSMTPHAHRPLWTPRATMAFYDGYKEIVFSQSTLVERIGLQFHRRLLCYGACNVQSRWDNQWHIIFGPVRSATRRRKERSSSAERSIMATRRQAKKYVRLTA